MRVRRLTTAESEAGAIAVVVALLSVVLFGLAAFTVDFGRAYAAKRQLSTAADAATLAAAAELGKVPGSCDTMIAADDSARAVAEQAVRDNARFGGAMSDFAAQPSTDSTGHCTGVTTRVDDAVTLRTFFGGFLGISSTSSSRSATAELDVANRVVHLRPYAVCQGIEDAENTSASHSFIVSINKPAPDCAAEVGGWGLVDLGGGVTEANVAAWTRDGAAHEIRVPNGRLGEDPGTTMNSSAVTDALNSIVGQTVLLPVLTRYDDVGGQGLILRMTGFMPAELCDWRVGADTALQPAACHEPAVTNDADQSGFDQYLEIRWRPGLTTSYTGGQGSCTFGTGCDVGTRTVRLVR